VDKSTKKQKKAGNIESAIPGRSPGPKKNQLLKAVFACGHLAPNGLTGR
jgi:hypothetical protein